VAVSRSTKAGTSGGGADVRRRWGKEVTSAGAATTGGEGGDVGASGDGGGVGEREQRLGGRETGIEAGRGGDKTWTRLGRLGPLLGHLFFLHH